MFPFTYWQPGDKANGGAGGEGKGQAIGKIRDLPELPGDDGTGSVYEVQPFGSKLIARTWDETRPPYLLFDKASWTWKPLPSSMKDVFIPAQLESRYYRVPLRD